MTAAAEQGDEADEGRLELERGMVGGSRHGVVVAGSRSSQTRPGTFVYALSTNTHMEVYFCDPHSPWQRGSNENTNGLLRQYFPRKSDLSVHSAAHLNAVARQLNNRPRQTLNWMKPSEVFGRAVASTG